MYLFQKILILHFFSFKVTDGTVTRTENWVLFLNSLIQFLYLSSPTPNLRLVDHISTLEINLLKHSKMVNDKQSNYTTELASNRVKINWLKIFKLLHLQIRSSCQNHKQTNWIWWDKIYKCDSKAGKTESSKGTIVTNNRFQLLHT